MYINTNRVTVQKLLSIIMSPAKYLKTLISIFSFDAGFINQYLTYLAGFFGYKVNQLIQLSSTDHEMRYYKNINFGRLIKNDSHLRILAIAPSKFVCARYFARYDVIHSLFFIMNIRSFYYKYKLKDLSIHVQNFSVGDTVTIVNNNEMLFCFVFAEICFLLFSSFKSSFSRHHSESKLWHKLLIFHCFLYIFMKISQSLQLSRLVRKEIKFIPLFIRRHEIFVLNIEKRRPD